MSEIKTLEKLRNAITTYAAECDERWLLAACDDVEAEIAERYVLLPVDADGVPIHVGEEMTCHGDVFTVCAVAPAKIHRWVTVKLGEPQTTYSYDPTECTHYKPRTLEDVLMDAGVSRAAISDVADEIRKLLGGDA